MDTYQTHSASEILQQDIEEITIEACEGGGGQEIAKTISSHGDPSKIN